MIPPLSPASTPILPRAVVVTCFDFRLQQALESWLSATLGYANYDRVSLAGSVKDWDAALAQIALAVRLHGVTQACLIAHENCMAYQAEGTYERLTHDLRQARDSLRRDHPELETRLFYQWLDGRFEPIE